MKEKEKLWDILNLNENFKCADVDIAYSKIKNKTSVISGGFSLIDILKASE